MTSPVDRDIPADVLASLVANVPAIIYRADWGQGGRIHHVAGSTRKVCGYAADYLESLSSLEFLKLVHPDDHNRLMDVLDTCAASGADTQIEYRVFHADGSVRWVSDSVHPVLDAGGGFLYHDGVIIDVTERREAEQELQDERRQSEQRRQLIDGLLDHTDAVIYAKDMEGRYAEVNRKWTEVIGLTREESIGRTDFELMPPEVARSLVETDRAAITSKKPVTREESPDASGDRRIFISNKFPLFDESGDVRYLAGVSYDVTALKNAQKSVAAANNRMKMDLEAAGRVQQALLPRDVPACDGYSFGWAYRPCYELGGDALDIFAVDEDTLAFYLLDVSGHGVPASLLAVTATRTLAPRSDRSSIVLEPGWDPGTFKAVTPGEVVRRLNVMNPMDPQRNPHFITMIYGILDLRSGRVRYACAGHPGPIVVRSSGDAEIVDGGEVPVGLMPDTEFRELTLQLEPGDRLFIHSDGLFEQRSPSGEEFGRERLRMQLASDTADVTIQVDRALMAAMRWSGGERVDDDLSIVGLSRLCPNQRV